jgi:Ca-activated chloride channel family protein
MAAATLALAASSLGWLDPHRGAREGNRLYAEGKYEEAAARYNEALVDRPDSPRLHFNLGDAFYKQGKYDDAAAAFSKVPTGEDDPERAARVAYNLGNTRYRLGEAAEASEPQRALELWGEALAAYRRAMGVAPDDVDVKFNHEFVERRIAALRQKLEEERQRQEQPQEQGSQEQKPQEQKPQDGQQAPQPDDRQQGEQPPAEQPSGEQADRRQEPREEQGEGQEAPAQAGGAAPEAGERGEESGLSREEAAALLDSQRDQEVAPEEVIRRLQGGVVAEPAVDW